MTEEELLKLRFPVGKFKAPTGAVDREALIQIIADFPHKIRNAVDGLSVEQLSWIYRPEGWNIKQVVHHCADSHMNALVRTKLALTEVEPVVKTYEEQLWAILEDGQDDDLEHSLMLINSLHAKWVKVLKSMSNLDFEKKFIHPAKQSKINLLTNLCLYAWHCEHHLAHIEQAKTYKGSF